MKACEKISDIQGLKAPYALHGKPYYYEGPFYKKAHCGDGPPLTINVAPNAEDAAKAMKDKRYSNPDSIAPSLDVRRLVSSIGRNLAFKTIRKKDS